MKYFFKSILIILSLSITNICQANETTCPNRTNQPIMSVIYGTGLKVQKVFNQTEALACFRATWIIDRQYYVSFLVSKVLAEPVFHSPLIGSYNTYMFTGGFELGYHLKLNDHFLLSPQVLLGIASNSYYYPEGDTYLANDMMLLEPGVYITYSAARHLNLYGGIGYHFTFGSKGPEEFKISDFDTPIVEFGLNLGYF